MYLNKNTTYSWIPSWFFRWFETFNNLCIIFIWRITQHYNHQWKKSPNGQDIAIIGKNRNGTEIFVKTTYHNGGNVRRKFKDEGSGRPEFPPSDPLVRTQPTSGSIRSDNLLSARQNPVSDIMGYASDFVKQFAEKQRRE